MAATYQLRAGDILLYRAKGFFGRIISIKTWHNLAHVEIYDGNLCSLASRDGIGVGRYPLRLSELEYVLRPGVDLDLERGHQWFQRMNGLPYGWLDLLNFMGLPVNVRGIVCSPFVAGYLRACGWKVFPEDSINKIAPFQFLDLIGEGGCTVAYGPLGNP